MPAISERVDRGAGRTRARVLGSYVDGWRRVWRAPAVTVGVLLATWLITPAISSDLGGSFFGIVVQETAPALTPADWSVLVATEIHGFTFAAELLAFAGLRQMVRGLAAGESLMLDRFGALAVYVGLWLFLSGGILDRLARDRPVRTAAFFAACGGNFLRLLRLGILAGAAYWALIWWVNPWLRAGPDAGFLIGTTLGIIGLASFATVSMMADFARVRTVVEDRRSVLGALVASIRFLSRRAGRAIALWLLHFFVVAALAGAWYYLATYPGARSWSDLLVVQLFVLFRLWTKLALLGAQFAFFQAELAHATYTASPLPVWPDSPSVEAIDNFLERRNSEPPA